MQLGGADSEEGKKSDRSSLTLWDSPSDGESSEAAAATLQQMRHHEPTSPMLAFGTASGFLDGIAHPRASAVEQLHLHR